MYGWAFYFCGLHMRNTLLSSGPQWDRILFWNLLILQEGGGGYTGSTSTQ